MRNKVEIADLMNKLMKGRSELNYVDNRVEETILLDQMLELSKQLQKAIVKESSMAMVEAGEIVVHEFSRG